MAALGCGWFIVAWLASANGHAASLGDLIVASKAGEPFDGQIPLIGAHGLQRRDIAVMLGSKEDFGNLGLARFGYLESLRFAVEPPYVLVSSDEPIADAYLNFVVRLSWPGGDSLREYAVLLDAPEPRPTLAQPWAFIAPDQTRPQASLPPEQPQPQASVPLEQQPQPPPAVPSARTVVVRPRDTLWSIAAANLPDGVNVQQQMLAIQRDNPQAFAAGNINGLVAGATLRLPSDVAATSLSPQQAIGEAGRQNDAWGIGGGGQLTIIDPGEGGPATEAVTEPPAAVAEPPPDAIAVAIPPPAPPLPDLLREARRQIREQASQLQRRDDEIARLSSELAALRAARAQERQDWTAALGRWRLAALAGLLPTAALIAFGLVARRRRGDHRAAAADAPGNGADRQSAANAAASDHDFGAPIVDGQVKLNLAKAYLDMGNRAAARELLDEVIAGGADHERSEAQALLERLAEGPSQPAQS